MLDAVNKLRQQSAKEEAQRCIAASAEIEELKAHVRILFEEYNAVVEARDQALEEIARLKK
jgi:uncharacterized coiled-coil DUF342 family protein